VLAADGSVSEPVARQLAEGALERCPASLALSVTGVLGPGPDEDGKPAGLVYFGLARQQEDRRNETQAASVIRERFSEQNPDAIRRAVVLRALELLLEAAR
jgi:nicotinamide-nucleotide amidase